MKKQIACTGQLDGPSLQGKSGWNLYVVDAEQASFQQVTFDLLIPRFTWSPDGHLIAFIAWSPDSQQIAFIRYDMDTYTYALGVNDADGQNQRSYPMEGEDLVGDLHPHAPTWSPDSQQIAYNGPGHHHFHLVKGGEAFRYLFTDNIWQSFEEENQEDEDEEPDYSNLILNPAWQP